jgi:hypothetical protein
LRRKRAGAGCDGASENRDFQVPDHDRYTFSMRTAHFLKSVCSESGSVASNVTLLISFDSSNQGTKTRPRGGRLRPRVSRRTRTKPRREISGQLIQIKGPIGPGEARYKRQQVVFLPDAGTGCCQRT